MCYSPGKLWLLLIYQWDKKKKAQVDELFWLDASKYVKTKHWFLLFNRLWDYFYVFFMKLNMLQTFLCMDIVRWTGVQSNEQYIQCFYMNCKCICVCNLYFWHFSWMKLCIICWVVLFKMSYIMCSTYISCVMLVVLYCIYFAIYTFSFLI